MVVVAGMTARQPADLRTFELQDVKSGVVVGEVHHALRIDEAVGGLDDLRPVRTRVEHALGIGRHEEPGLARLERILMSNTRTPAVLTSGSRHLSSALPRRLTMSGKRKRKTFSPFS
jgi:hypothetical protein